MKLFTIDMNERDFLTCFMHESILFASTPSFSTGDHLLFTNEGYIAGVASIHTLVSYEKGCKCHLSFDYTFLPSERIALHETLFADASNIDPPTGMSYIGEESFGPFWSQLNEVENHLGLFLTDAAHLLEQAENEQSLIEKQDIRRKQQHSLSHTWDKHMGDHQKAQYCLNEIANICNLQTWTASNDKNRLVHQQKLGAIDISSFPLLDTSPASQKTIELIDTIWLKENRPVCAFEIETSTTIYSGLLRMADLATILSTSNLHLYIVAPKERASKFVREIRRPLFQQIQMEKYCHFIPLESLDILYQKIKGLDGYVDFHVLNVIRQSAEQLENLQR